MILRPFGAIRDMGFTVTPFLFVGEKQTPFLLRPYLVPLLTRAKHDEAVLSPLRGILIFPKSLIANTV